MKIVKSNAIPVTAQSEPQVAKLKEVAELYEKEFMRQMLKQMRATVPNSGLVTQNQAEKIFSDELYNHYGDMMADQGPQSLRDHIYKNLLEKFGAQLGVPQDSVPKGQPIPLTSKDNLAMNTQVRAGQAGVDVRYRWSAKTPSQVQAPAEGSVLGVKSLTEGFTEVSIRHADGLVSSLKFLGRPQVKAGDYLSLGQKVAELNPNSKELVWNLEVERTE